LLLLPLVSFVVAGVASAALGASVDIEDIPDYREGDVAKLSVMVTNTGDETFGGSVYLIMFLWPNPETGEDGLGVVWELQWLRPGERARARTGEIKMLMPGDYDTRAYAFDDADGDLGAMMEDKELDRNEIREIEGERFSNVDEETFAVVEKKPPVPIAPMAAFAAGLPVGFVAFRRRGA